MEDRTVTIDVARERLGNLSRTTVMRKIAQERLVGVKDDDGVWRITEASIQAEIDSRKPPGRPKKEDDNG